MYGLTGPNYERPSLVLSKCRRSLQSDGSTLRTQSQVLRRCPIDAVNNALQPPGGRLIALYLFSHVGKSLLWAAADVLTLWVLVILFLVNPAIAGLAFFVGLVANAAADGLVGIWIDRYPSHTRSLAAIGFCAASGIFPMTMLAANWGTGPLLAATLAFRMAYAAYDVPHNAQMSRLAPTPPATLLLSRGRTIGTGIAGLLVALVVREWITVPETVGPVVWILAIAAAVGCTCLLPLLPADGACAPSGDPMPKLGTSLAFLLASMIGIIALGAIAKAMLHLPPPMRQDTGDVLMLLMAGRMASALVPFRFTDARRGLTLLGLVYVLAAMLVIVIGFRRIDWLGIVGLGLALGTTNLLGWALLPLLAKGPRDYGLYTMVSKLALGLSGFVMTLALGHRIVFEQTGLAALCIAAAAASTIGALVLAYPARLTQPGSE